MIENKNDASSNRERGKIFYKRIDRRSKVMVLLGRRNRLTVEKCRKKKGGSRRFPGGGKKKHDLRRFFL